MNRPTAWPSFTEHGAFEKKNCLNDMCCRAHVSVCIQRATLIFPVPG